MGTALTWSSPVIPKLKDHNETPFDTLPSTEDITWISSLTLLGASFGSPIYSFLAHRIGRRITLISLGVPALTAYLMMGFFQKIEIYYAARFMIGTALGGSFSVVPIYIAELASKSNRAALSTLIGSGVNGGCLLSYAIGPFLKVNIFNIVLSTMPACFLVLFTLFGEETAHYHLSQGRESDARKTLTKLRGENDDIEIELKDMQNKLYEQNQGSLMELLKKKAILKAFCISIGLLLFQQFSGINVFLLYSQTIFEMSGSNLDPKFCPIIVGVVQFSSSILSIPVADKFGRKPLLIASSAGMISALIPLGTYCYLKDENYDLNNFAFLPILCLTLVAVMYNVGLGPIPWAILAEIFPARIKALGTSIATIINWTLAFFLTKYFESLTEMLGLGQSFWLYAACCGLCILFVLYLVVETRGKTLEEIQDDLSR